MSPPVGDGAKHLLGTNLFFSSLMRNKSDYQKVEPNYMLTYYNIYIFLKQNSHVYNFLYSYSLLCDSPLCSP